MVELSRPAKKMIHLAMAYEGKPVDFDEKDGPQCADLSAFLIKNATGKTIWGNAIETGSKENIDIINKSEYNAKMVSPDQDPIPGDLLVEDTGDDICHVSLVKDVHDDGKVTVYEQNYNGDAETNPKGVEKRTRDMADKEGWGKVKGYLRIED